MSELYPSAPEAISREVSIEELTTILGAAGVPLELWGQGSAKTIEHLHKEIVEGESEVYRDASGSLRRQVAVTWVDVLYISPSGETFLLKEDRQVFTDGRVRTRTLPGSLMEKRKPGEEAVDAAMRALSEEINIDDPVGLYQIPTETKPSKTDSYPGLNSSYAVTGFVAEIPHGSYKPEGYIEVQPDKTNYYVWEQLHPVQP